MYFKNQESQKKNITIQQFLFHRIDINDPCNNECCVFVCVCIPNTNAAV